MCYFIVYIHEDFWYVVCVCLPSWCVYEAFEHLKIVWDIISLCFKCGKLLFWHVCMHIRTWNSQFRDWCSCFVEFGRDADSLQCVWTSNLLREADSVFEALVLFQVSLDQRVLKLNLCSKVQSASIFHKEHFGDHVVHAKPSAEAIKSCEIWKNRGFWAKSWFLKAIYRLLGAHLCLGVHWNGQKWKVWWI